MDEQKPSIDFTFLDSMLRVSKGNPKFVTVSVGRFLKSVDQYNSEIQEFRQTEDREALKQKSHKFISSCSVVGAMHIIDICHLLSRKSDDQDKKAIEVWLDDLNTEIAKVTEILNDYLSKLTATA